MLQYRFLPVFILFFCTLTFGLKAQNGIVRGFVFDEETGNPIPYTNVIIPEINKGNATEASGFFIINNVKPGEYTLFTTYVGYDTAEITIKVKAGEITQQNIYLSSKGIDVDDVEVSGSRMRRESETNVSRVRVSQKDIERMPTIGGEADIAQYLQVLPGVVFTGDQGGQLYIRGGTPIQNKVLLDGMTIYNPFHSIGLFSVFDNDILETVDVYAGGFNAEHGERIGSVMDIRTRAGNKKRFAGKVSATTFNGKVLLEGPLKKFEAGESSTSFLLSTRTSYLNQTAPTLYGYADSNGLPFSFTDVYGKINVSSPEGTDFNLFGFRHLDRVRFENTTNYEWDAAGAGFSLRLVPTTSSTTIDANFAYSNYEMRQIEVLDARPRTSRISGFEGALNFNYYPGDNHLRYGILVSGFNTDFSFFNPLNRRIAQQTTNTQFAVFTRYTMQLGNWIIDPGFRLQYYASLQESSPEPRLTVKYKLSDNLRLKAAGGFYSQNLISARSDRDVVNLFFGIIAAPDNTPERFDGEPVDGNIQLARHAILGVEYDLGKYITLNLEGYYLQFDRLTDINRNKVFDNSPAFQDYDERLRMDYIFESGNSYGLDFLFKFNKEQYYVWLAYSFGFVNRFDGVQDYHPHWDRRHNLNFLAAYSFGKHEQWSFSGRWNMGSGFPFTQTQGYYELIDFQMGTGTDYLTENGDLGILYADINEGRLPYYHRLDLSLKRRFEFSKYRILEITASATNVYNRENLFYYNRVTNSRVNQLPIIPAIGFSYQF